MSAASPPAFRADVLRGVRHGFFGRQGGVSGGIYASLNAGTGSDDDAIAVADNRALIAQAMGVEHLIGVHQVHSPDVVVVDGPWRGERPRADALVTKTQGLAISVLTADCAPVLFADQNAGVIAAAHAGWKGALAGVLENTVQKMRELGAAQIAAAIGPCIHRGSYEVGPEFEAQFLNKDSAFECFFTPGIGDRLMFNLPGFCVAALKTAGIDQIEIIPLDTYVEESLLFSHRRSVHRGEAGYGRNCAAIAL